MRFLVEEGEPWELQAERATLSLVVLEARESRSCVGLKWALRVIAVLYAPALSIYLPRSKLICEEHSRLLRNQESGGVGVLENAH